MARPKIEADAGLIEQLASYFCSLAEIAAATGVSVSTLGRNYDEAIKRGLERGKTSLKRKQFEVAMKGNTTMLIWLGKQHLGQKDKSADEIAPVIQVATNMKPKEIFDLIQAARKEKETT